MTKHPAKKRYREIYREIRSNVLKDVEHKIYKNVRRFIIEHNENSQRKGYLGIYWPLNGEIDLRGLQQEYKSSLALPACHKKRSLIYHPWSKSNTLKKDSCGIPSPVNEEELKPKQMSLLIVPGLAIDKYGFRLGYGGGFFDSLRVNKEWRLIPAIVVLPKACCSEEPLPQEPWDIPFNGWINEDGFFNSSSKQNPHNS